VDDHSWHRVDVINRREVLIVKIAYVAGPYRSKFGKIGIFINIIKARRIAKQLWKMGYLVICPHMNSAFMGCKDISEKQLMDGYLELIPSIDIMVLVPGWEKSEGTKEEIQVAYDLEKRIFDWAGELNFCNAVKAWLA
jgi:hypothetical protein